MDSENNTWFTPFVFGYSFTDNVPSGTVDCTQWVRTGAT